MIARHLKEREASMSELDGTSGIEAVLSHLLRRTIIQLHPNKNILGLPVYLYLAA